MTRIFPLGLVVFFLLVAGIASQKEVALPLEPKSPQRLWTQCRLTQMYSGSARNGGYGYTLLRLSNPDRRVHRVKLDLKQICHSGTMSISRQLDLPPGGTDSLYLPIPPDCYSTRGSIQADNFSPKSIYLNHSSGRVNRSPLLVADSNRRQGHFANYLAKGYRTFKGLANPPPSGIKIKDRADVKLCPANDLPPRWQMLTCFQLILVDCGDGKINPGQEKVLLDYTASGGLLVLLDPGALPAGPLTEALFGLAPGLSGHEIKSLPQPGVWRFGRFFAMPTAAKDTRLFRNWLDGSWEMRLKESRGYGPLRESTFAAISIPGVGKVPVGFFFFLIFLFVILVGPLNFFFCQYKWKKPLLLLVTVPGLGFGFTGMILLYGLFSEGLGIKGAIYSYTLIDQVRQEKADQVMRRIYAGLRPDVIKMQADNFLAWHTGESNQRDRKVDLDKSGRFNGSFVAPRTPLTLASAQVGMARERIRFQRTKGGAYRVLAGPDFHPLAGSQVFFRDLNGDDYGGPADGLLQPLDLKKTNTLIQKLIKDGTAYALAPDRSSRRPYYSHRVTGKKSKSPLVYGYTKLDVFVPGSYLIRVAAVPGQDDLGLKVDFRKAEHLVKGRLDPEDIIE